MGRKFFIFELVLVGVLGSSLALAEDAPVKFKSTGEGDQTLSTGYSPSDPLGSKPVNKEWDAGHPTTQAPYDENCKDDRCIRAEQRQTGTTTWQEDRASGLHVSPKKATGTTPSDSGAASSGSASTSTGGGSASSPGSSGSEGKTP